MKRFMTTLVAALLVCAMSIFALTACNVTLEEMDGSEYYDAPYKERCVELVSDFFEETLKDPDFVVTCKDKDGAVQYTETVKGTASCTLYQDGSMTYAFKKGEHFYVARITLSKNKVGEIIENHTYQCSDSTKPGYYAGTQERTMEDLYKSDYCRFMSKETGAGIVKELPEENAEFHGRVHIKRVSNYPTGTLDFTYTTEKGTLDLTASSEGDKVNSLRLVTSATTEGGYATDLTWTFVHGNASVTLPDTDAWDGARA